MKIEQRTISKLKKSKFFKRKHSEQQIKKACISLLEYGQYQPIIVSGNQILCGNLIYLAAKVMGMKKLFVHDLGEISDEKKKEIRYLDNKTFELSNWNEDGLKELLMSIDSLNLNEFGFSENQAYEYINDLSEQIEEKKINQLVQTFEQQKIYFCEKCGWQGEMK